MEPPPLESSLQGDILRASITNMTINADWHREHPMPKNPTVEQRIAWHLAHQEHCACRPIPEKLRDLMAACEKESAPRRRPRR